MKFIHLSNVRLGSYEPITELGINRREECNNDFYRVLDVCGQEDVDLLFITGNLFGNAPSVEQLKELDKRFASMPNTRVFWALGRDEVNSEVVSYQFESNTILFGGDCIQRIFVAKLSLEVTGVGYSDKNWGKVSQEKLTGGKKGEYQVLLLPFIGENEKEIPQNLLDMELPFDYVGVGQTVPMMGDQPKKVYAPGLFEPNGFSKQQKHGYYMGTIGKDAGGQHVAEVSFKGAAMREFLTLRVNVTPDLSIGDIERQIGMTIESLGKDHIYRIVLKGEMSVSTYYQKSRLKLLGNILDITDETKVNSEMVPKDAAQEAVMRFINCMNEQEDSSIKELAIELGIKAILNGTE